ncbi:pentapeptide repeat-containing protein [Amaricoccus macauensis]|uniref:pentapeptide repeat-containing protein n=1 Tax=Amaricoccus macauensis TaxID=57001 RepID=UPI003C7C00A2
MDERTQAQIARINEISALARTSWIGLLAYLAFVFVTLLGVEDADFFVPARQTQLPLVNVSIPTASFFIFGPVLAAALYVYLHLFLLKLWDAIAEMPSQVRTDWDRPEWKPLSEVIHPWLANDYACKLKGPEAHPSRPLHRLSAFVTWVLVWVSGPFVIGYAWARSMPAHDEWLTLLIALCLFVSLIAGATSWFRTRERLRRQRIRAWRRVLRVITALAALIFLLSRSWIHTEGGMDNYVSGWWTLADVSITVPQDTPILRWWLDEDWDFPLAQTNLVNVELVPLPPDWRDYQSARMAFRETWCRREGLSMSVCDHRKGNGREAPPHVATARTDYCKAHGIDPGAPCDESFAALDRRFDATWEIERKSLNAALPSLDLAGRDLRGMNASGATLVGANLSWAQMEGADLSSAQLEGADLSWAQMEGAVLSGAQMDGADLEGAQMEGADLEGAQMDGADLGGAQLEGADLEGAQMDGADLSSAQLEGANLREAQMEGAILWIAQMEGADFSGAQMEGANLSWAQMEGADLSWAQMEGANLRGAQMEGADFSWAQMDGANLREAQMEGAILWIAQMEGAILRGAQMEGANLREAQMDGADLRRANLKFASWAGAHVRSPAQDADFRGGRGIAQEQLDQMIGNAGTLLPISVPPHSIPSCWPELPASVEAMIPRIFEVQIGGISEEDMRAEFLCPAGEAPQRTGTPCALDLTREECLDPRLNPHHPVAIGPRPQMAEGQ